MARDSTTATDTDMADEQYQEDNEKFDESYIDDETETIKHEHVSVSQDSEEVAAREELENNIAVHEIEQEVTPLLTDTSEWKRTESEGISAAAKRAVEELHEMIEKRVSEVMKRYH
jgi:hypothetical protein